MQAHFSAPLAPHCNELIINVNGADSRLSLTGVERLVLSLMHSGKYMRLSETHHDFLLKN